MKKIFKAFFIMAATTATIISCSKESGNEAITNNENLVQLTIIASNPQTKTSTKTEIDGVTPYWSVGDAIGITNGTSNYMFTTDITSKSATASFTGAVEVSSDLYAYYPFTANGLTTQGDVKIDLPGTQKPTVSSFDGNADLMIAKKFAVDPASTTVENLEFKRLGAIVKIVLIDKDAVMISEQHPASVSMTAENYLTGRIYLKLEDQELGEVYYNQSYTATAEYTENTQYVLNGQNATYLVVYPQTLEEDSSLTVKAETEDYVIEKNITVPQGGIALEAGKITTLNINLEASHISVATGGDELPFADDMGWANNGSSDNGTDLATTIEEASNGLYVAASKAYKGIGGLKLGTGSANGYVTTKQLNLSGAFYIEVEGENYGSDTGNLVIKVDDTQVLNEAFAAVNYVNIPAGTYTNKSKVTIGTSDKRGRIYSVAIKSGEYVPAPVINVTSDNPMAVDNSGDFYTIEYNISNPSVGVSIIANSDVEWIHDFDYNTAGEITFEVDAQESGAPARTGNITLTYEGATAIDVVVNQAAGSGGSSTKTFTIASADVVSGTGYKAHTATVDNRDWVITFGGNNKSVGTNKNNRSSCNLSNYSKYAVSPVTTSSTASAFASTTSISNVSKVSYTINGGSNQDYTKVYLIYSSDGTNFSQVSLTSTSVTQGATISSGAEYEFEKCTGYFALLFEATNTSGNWRIDDVEITFTYEE